MPFQFSQPLRRAIASLLLTCLIHIAFPVQPVLAGEVHITPLKGWGLIADQEEAWKSAHKKGVPVAILYTERMTTCPKCVAASNRFMTTTAWANAAKLLTYPDDQGVTELVHGPRTAFISKYGRTRENLLVPCVLLLDSRQ